MESSVTWKPPPTVGILDAQLLTVNLFRKNPKGDDDILWEGFADGLYILQLALLLPRVD